MEQNATKPNFFIIGAPKCGTTALSEYLRDHKDIFFSEPKELYFWSTDILYWQRIPSEKEYLLYFKEGANYKAVGEGTAIYLYSKDAVPNILKFNPNAKLIAMLRNPMDMAPALHAESVFAGDETEKDFEKAWHLQEVRARGERIPPMAEDPTIFQYGSICKLGEQIERLFSVAPREQIHLIFFDDFIKDTKKVYEETLSFLGVPQDQKTEFPQVNARKAVKNKVVQKVMDILYFLKWKSGIKRRFGILTFFKEKFTQEVKRPPQSDAFRAELRNYFKEDILLLARLTNRDLSSWLK